MTQRILNPEEKTLGEFIQKHYPGFRIWGGTAPMDMDISHGIEVEYWDNRKRNYGEGAHLSPFVLWSDGGYRPVKGWGTEYYICLEKK